MIKKTPNINWFIQSVNLPGLQLPVARVDTPFVRIPFSGDQIIFEDLRVTFRVDEEMTNYLELYNWFVGTGFPEEYSQYAGTSPSNSSFEKKSNIKSDGTLLVMNSKMNPVVEITFYDLAPIAISDIVFNTTLPDVNYIEATATFSYLRYTVAPV
jgi:hypothetical protein